MQYETVFSVANLLATVAWVVLAAGALLPRLHTWALRFAGLGVPGLLAVAYLMLVIGGREAFTAGGYSSLAAVRVLFANDAMLTAGWLHYLAFDLFVGAWIVREARDFGIPGWLILPHLLFTFLFGPLGLLLFLATRPFYARTAKA
jgi:hypothetical protein